MQPDAATQNPVKPMPYSRRTRGQFIYISVVVAFGAFLVGREVRDHYRNSARLVEFRADSACVAPLTASRPAQSALCHDESAEITARWSRARSRSRSSDYYLALRLSDGFVDTLMLVFGREETPDAARGQARAA